MKKITLFILTIFTVATLYAAARPSLDGRAVVAETGTMPRGLFARTVGYLPGDSVTVTNPATGSTVDVLILGAIDPSEGVAILLSPEAADGLRIKPDSNVQVKLTKRSGSLDENANGSAVLSDVAEENESADIASNVSSDYEEKSLTAENTAPVETAFPAVEKTAPVAEESALIAEKESEPEPENLEERMEVVPAIAEEKEPVKETVVPEAVRVAKELESEPETVYEEIPALAEEELEKVACDDLIEENDKLQKVVLVETESAENPVEESVQPVTEEVAAIEEEIAPVTEEVAVLAEERDSVVNEEIEPVTEEISAVSEEKVQPEFIAEETEPEESEVEPYTEEPLVAMEESAETEENEAYQPIILVPTEPKAPVAQEIESAAVEEKSVEEKVELAKEEKPAVVKEEVAKTPVSNDWSNYVVPSLKNLRSGSYYVQVASLGNTDNIKTFVDKYSAKYPVVLVQNSAKTAYQVMVGPLNIDEYGSVGEKFKGWGFKDSFVRKIR